MFQLIRQHTSKIWVKPYVNEIMDHIKSSLVNAFHSYFLHQQISVLVIFILSQIFLCLPIIEKTIMFTTKD
jgi:hypothetical protein